MVYETCKRLEFGKYLNNFDPDVKHHFRRKGNGLKYEESNFFFINTTCITEKLLYKRTYKYINWLFLSEYNLRLGWVAG